MFKEASKTAWVSDIVLIEVIVEKRRAIRFAMTVDCDVLDVPTALRLRNQVGNFVVMSTVEYTKFKVGQIRLHVCKV